jgi:hypothetical protein
MTPSRRAEGASRTLHADVLTWYAATGEQRLVLGAGGGELIVELIGRGTRDDDAAGVLRLDALDRELGAGFVDAMARWLGTPLGPAATFAGPARAVRGIFATLKTERDADGMDWDLFELFVGDTQLVLRVSDDHARATFTETWRPHRAPLLASLDRALGACRLPASRTEVVLGGGLALIAIPTTWSVSRVPRSGSRRARGTQPPLAAHDRVRVADPCERVAIDLSCVAAHGTGVPEVGRMLRDGLVQRGFSRPRIAREDRGDLALAWHDDADGEARSRLLVAANDVVHVIATLAYRDEDTDWALAEWDRVVSTLELARPRPA